MFYTRLLAAVLVLGVALSGCGGTPESFEGVTGFMERHADAIVLEGDDGAKVLVSPKLQGRIMTITVGDVASTGFVNFPAIEAGEVHPQFNNFGGLERPWIGPEAGPNGLYFPPGAEFHHDTWQVPAAFDKGPFSVLEKDEDSVAMERAMEVTNWKGVDFNVHVEREVGVLRAASLSQELGLEELPSGVHYAGCYSQNKLANSGDVKWDPEKGLICIWILGQLNPSPQTVVIAPFHPGDDKGPIFNDDYFGKVSELTPERLKVVGNAVCLLGDAMRIGKFGLSQRRTKGIAGSYDFGKNLLTVVKFTVPETPERYGNFLWVKDQDDLYGGDTFQSYNNGDRDNPGEISKDAPFYELESTSPVRPLAPKESISHRHATHHFQGPPEAMADLARKLLGVELEDVKKAMGIE